MNSYYHLFDASTEYQQIKNVLLKGHTPVAVTGCVDSQKVHFISSLGRDYRVKVIVCGNDIRAREVYDDLKLFETNACFYPAKDLIFYSVDIKGTAVVKDRIACIRRLLDKEPVTIVMSADALMDKILPVEYIKRNIINIKPGDIVDLTEMSSKLVSLGYTRQSQVSEPGEFAIRGGIFDVFALNDEAPVRIELFGDEVDIIKVFDVDSQRSIENIQELVIYPAAEFVLTDEEMETGFEKIRKECESREKKLRKEMKNEEASRLKKVCEEAIENIEYSRGSAQVDSFVNSFYSDTVSIIDYFDKDALIVFDEPIRMEEKCQAVQTEFSESMIGRLESGYILPSQADVVYDYKAVFGRAALKRLLIVSNLDYGFAGITPKEKFSLIVKSVNPYNQGITYLVSDLVSYKKKGYRTIVLSASAARGRRLAEELTEYDLIVTYSDDKDRAILPGEIVIRSGALHKGFDYPSDKFCVLIEGEGSFTKVRKKKKVQSAGKQVLSLHELTYGDYVVHERNGLGIYRGIERKEYDRKVQDYIKIEYGDGELYIPATGLEAIQKFASGDAEKLPKINKLNSKDWQKTKSRVQTAVSDIAKQLVQLYAIRNMQEGFQCEPDNQWQKEFEEMFPYEETSDQLKAIEETKRDMESKRIMDRLLCGDVGFGKTEVAIRAAFKAVQNNKQVAVLVPTTVLAQQHYNTFSARMVGYPIGVELLSRFRTPAQQKESLNKLAKGSSDIVIGTHRLLSKDIKFKNLGLLIVDEEQRFGVTHKEKIKEMKKDVDVLTLSATPIPRTLHMSLSGIRDMSVLEEPPVDRLPIQTFVLEHNDEIIREAVNREIARGGQVYYISNRVSDIEEKALKVQALCPDAVVAFAHGQMSERELERIMYEFISGEIDVLVSTTIVETGIDISNVNTMIIDDADKLGLSQLYQLRGRVGRSSRTAYAFLMYKRGAVLKEIAEKRLSAIRDFSDLGSGFKIAMRDLEIRGAGNVLGAEQSGHMEEVGYDLYCKMLDTAIRKEKGEDTSLTEFDTTIKMSVDAFIPATYIKNEIQKLDMYKRISVIETEEEREDMIEELEDRYGELPTAVNNLLYVAQIKAMCHSVYITSIVQQGEGAKLTFYPKAPMKTELLNEWLNKHGSMVKITFGEAPFLTYVAPKVMHKCSAKELQDIMFRNLKDLIQDMKELF